MKSLEPGVQPSPRSRPCHTRDSQTENGASFRSEKRVTASSNGRVGSLSNSSTRSLMSQPISRTDKAEHLVTEMGSPGSRSSRTRYELCKQDQASRKRFELALVASAKSPSPNRPRASSSKRVEASSPRAVLGTHEAAIRGFKMDLGNQEEDALEKAVGDQEVDSQPEKLPLTPPRSEEIEIKIEPPGPSNADVHADYSHGSPSISKATPEKPVSNSGFRSIRFRNRSGRQEKDVVGQGNRVFPSDKRPVVKPVSPPLTKDAKLAGAGFSYSMLFSGRKQGDKKEGTDKGEALAMKRTDSALMRSLLRRPTSPTHVSNTKPVSQYTVKKTTKPSKKVDVEDDVEKVETANVEAIGDTPSPGGSSEEACSPTREQFDGSNLVQARYRSIDDVFPELPMEENNEGGASPDLSKTIKAVEEQFLGFDSQGESAACRSIERMFGKGFSRSYVSALSTSPDFSVFDNPAPETSPTSPEVFVTECGSVPGTFPNSPLVKYEKTFFSSRNHLNLQDMFDFVSGDRPNDRTGGRRSFCLSEPRERVLSPSDDDEAAADVDTFSNSAVCDTGGTPERLEVNSNVWELILCRFFTFAKEKAQMHVGVSHSNSEVICFPYLGMKLCVLCRFNKCQWILDGVRTS